MMQRMFLAAWPNDDQIERLLEIQDQLDMKSGRWVVPENFHITLLFLGDISSVTKECIISHCNLFDGAPIDLTFSELGYFPKSEILWFGPSEVPLNLQALHRYLRGTAHQCQLRGISKKFIPHVSLVRRCRFPALPTQSIAPFEWQIQEFHLVSSLRYSDGARYEIVHTFPLGACS